MDVENDVEKDVENDVDKEDKEDMCIICLNDDLTISEKCVTQCNHLLCKQCLEQVFEKSNKCPMCRGEITTYYCDGIETRLLYIEKKRIRNIQTIIEQRNTVSINNHCKLLTISFLLASNGILGFLLIHC
jgi:hypothetical protein